MSQLRFFAFKVGPQRPPTGTAWPATTLPRSAACIDSVLSQLRQTNSKSDPNTVIGFLAQLFSASPEEKQRILRGEPSPYVRSVDLVALYRAGLLDDARKFADENQLSATLQKMEASRLVPLAAVRSLFNPADNDLLIGAYMASGDTSLIGRILGNFSDADDGSVSDALRMGFMHSKFGPSLTAEGRENVMAKAACARYQCKIDPAKFLRVLTLASASWALQSLASADDGIKKTFSGFFANDPRLKNLLAAEQAAFGNYMTAYTLLAVFNGDPKDGDKTHETMNKAALAYENLEPADKVFDHIEAYVKSGKQSK